MQLFLTLLLTLVGDFKNAIAINTIILITKKRIYNAMKKEQKLHILGIKNDVKNFYFQEKYQYYIKGKKVFKKDSFLVANIYKDQ